MTDETSSQALNIVTIILALGSILAPVVFGFVLWKMSQIFVSKEEFHNFKVHRDTLDSETKDFMKEIRGQMSEVLQRTAHLRDDR